MATTTTNFGWDIPQSTDLVKDGATAIAALGQDIDTALVDLKGGTTGQILSKASNTDLDYTWITNDVGDITAVTAGTGISGGGTSGSVTITNSMATAITTAGDVIYGTGSGTFVRLGIGTAGQLLKVNSGATAPEWSNATTAGLTLISSAAFTSSSAVNVNSCFSSTYKNYKLIVNFTSADANRDVKLRLRVSGTDASGSNYSYGSNGMRSDGVSTFNTSANNTTSFDFARANSGNKVSSSFEFFRPFEASPTVMQGKYAGDDNTTPFFNDLGGLHTLSTSYDGFTIFPTAGNISGNYFIYGYAN